MNLLEAWGAWEPGEPPHVLDADREILLSASKSRSRVVYPDWRTAAGAPDFARPGDSRLHLGLLPQPFQGDVRRASIYLLMLNPGLDSGNYFSEHMVPDFREAILANLRQEFHGGPSPFLFLDPRFAWDSGFRWWHGKIAGLLLRLADAWNIPYASARARLASSMACIELFPYHSESFRDSDRWLERLPSVRLAREFVASHVLPRVRLGEAIVIVTRKVREWGLERAPGVVLYDGQQSRAAHLSPDSPGGRAILEHLLRKG